MGKKTAARTAARLWAIALLALIIGFAAGYFAFSSSAAPAEPPSESVEARMGRVLADFHETNSGNRLYDIFDDAVLLFEERKNETTVFKYVYSPSANKTVVVCDRNATIAICPGRMDGFLQPHHIASCIMHPTTVLLLVNYTG